MPTDRDDKRAADRPGVAGEALGSLFAALIGPLVLLVNLWNAYGFLTSADPRPEHTATYLVVSALMVAGVVWTFHSARRRDARGFAYVWHALVAVFALVAVTMLSVPQVDLDTVREPPPTERYVDDDPCYSGGDPCG
ncbi:DUF6234 family protein [Promicromonospora citrea]|uniref:DUF6234 domain-containing protein n=1 Tax=Promicromonospora citrea TaxID=43677 RepID=A0A8H9GKZ4_9MICO|nr:DUF6234 family protein [Promicromonospora citrea]NNH52048.1 hypothetical protein [Promicromonospora citrea]GGM34305.1 hypothetical protein GCM10010102_32340 [Promicromonospora citrea]